MKRLLVTAILLAAALPCLSQTPAAGVPMPWTIERREGIKEMRQYIPSDSVIGARKLLKTVQYDRHGYETGPLIALQYDTLGRLTQRIELQQRHIAGATLTDTARIQHLQYSPEGLVLLYRDIAFRPTDNTWYSSRVDTHIVAYRLTGVRRQSGLGVVQCSYRRTRSWRPASYFGIDHPETPDTQTTITYRRTLDTLGRTVAEETEEGVLAKPIWRREYRYDGQGRIAQEIRTDSERQDTLHYRYNTLGALIGMDGVAHSAGMKADIHIRCQSDGKPLEETTTWWDAAEEGDPDSYPLSVQRTYYNERGDIVRTTCTGDPTYEYDYTYRQ